MTAPDGPALGLLELCSVARGIRTADAMVKRAPVRLVRAASTDPGKYLIHVAGGVDEVYEAMREGRAIAAESLIDQVFLPNPHDALPGVLERPARPPLDALGVLEGFSVAGVVRGADAALKAAEVRPVRLSLARDLGGKAFFVFTGALHDIEAAMDAGRAALGEALLAGCEIIPNPHPDLVDALA